MNEQLEFLRLKCQDAESLKERKKLYDTYFVRIKELGAAVAAVHPTEQRRKIYIGRFDALPDPNTTVPRYGLMPHLDLLCEIYQKTNNNNVRRLIDQFDGGWK
jgi:hypothetical protein